MSTCGRIVFTRTGNHCAPECSGAWREPVIRRSARRSMRQTYAIMWTPADMVAQRSSSSTGRRQRVAQADRSTTQRRGGSAKPRLGSAPRRGPARSCGPGQPCRRCGRDRRRPSGQSGPSPPNLGGKPTRLGTVAHVGGSAGQHDRVAGRLSRQTHLLARLTLGLRPNPPDRDSRAKSAACFSRRSGRADAGP